MTVAHVKPDWRAERPWLDDTPVCDGLLPWTDVFLPANAELPTQLKRFRDAGIDHISITATAGRDSMALAQERLCYLRSVINACQDWLVVASGQDAIETAHAARKMSVSFHFQTATPFSDSLNLVDAFLAAGIDRAILAYNEANPFANGCHEVRNARLSALGRRLVERMDATGMRIDLRHCGTRTSLDVLDTALLRPPCSLIPTHAPCSITSAGF
ncbi:membrane dipeptidase (peptidase family M19) [Paraburkholderia silvatlantica]|uniref:Membrane dipeptidase (Peptidase family M19) n=1 Tax=Paraburkholderia silvatlantica TaxID=321895 RepID=A0A2V4TH69_9BURK|nr:membrane dipeptidase (peptidase family M19) [Paraburkholderia silvatlantica]TDQ72323.1 membrane dipeptidase (peptidase family M19) [Paraburkholderia silvatlantica]